METFRNVSHEKTRPCGELKVMAIKGFEDDY